MFETPKQPQQLFIGREVVCYVDEASFHVRARCGAVVQLEHTLPLAAQSARLWHAGCAASCALKHSDSASSAVDFTSPGIAPQRSTSTAHRMNIGTWSLIAFCRAPSVLQSCPKQVVGDCSSYLLRQ